MLPLHLEHAAGLLVNEARNALDATTASQAADSGLCDALDVVTEDLAVALGPALAKALAALATSGHLWTVEWGAEGGCLSECCVEQLRALGL
jgi:hypothetical protein